MVGKLFKIFQTEFSGLHKAAYLLGAFALVSQILALLRDRLLAHHFGASTTLDVYYAAFRIPDFIYISIASFVSITVLIPFLVKRIGWDTEDGTQARAFLNSVFSVFLIVIFLVVGVVFFLVPRLAHMVVPGFSPEETDMFVMLTRLLLLSPVILGISSMMGSVSQVYRKFFVYASAPVLYNIGIIIGIVALLPIWGIYGVVFGVLIGAIMHLLIQLPVVLRHNMLPLPTLAIDVREVREVVKLSLPRTIALSSSHVTLIALIALASFMTEGSIAIFNFSFNLQSVPLSIIGVSYSVAAFPTLARLFSNGDRGAFVAHVETAVRHIVFWSIPAIVLFVVLRAQIVRTVLGSGAFDWADTRLTAAALALFVVSILSQALVQLFVRGYYAAGYTRIPLIVNVCSSIAIIGLAFLFVYAFGNMSTLGYFMEHLLRIEDVPGAVVIMLPLAYSIGMIGNALLLGYVFRRKFAPFSGALARMTGEVFAASIIMGFVAHQFLAVFNEILDTETLYGIFGQGLFAGLMGIAAGIFTLILLGNREIREVGETFKRRFDRVRVIAPDQEEL